MRKFFSCICLLICLPCFAQQVLPRSQKKVNQVPVSQAPVTSGTTTDLSNSSKATVKGTVPNQYLDIADGIYRIKVVQNDLYLGFKNDAYAKTKGTSLVQWQKEPGNHLLFRIRRVGPDKSYSIESLHSGYLLDVYERNTADGAKVVQWNATNTSNQHWYFLPLGNGTVALVSKLSGKRLELLGGNASWSGWGQPLVMGSYNRQSFMLQPERQTYRHQVKITVKDLELGVRKRGDYEFYGNIWFNIKDAYGKTLVRFYDSKSSTAEYLMMDDDMMLTDLRFAERVEKPGRVEMRMEATEAENGFIDMYFELAEDDADIGTIFKSSRKEDYVDPNAQRKTVTKISKPAGADDFYVVRSLVIGGEQVRCDHNISSVHIRDLGAETRVHVVLQDDDGSDNFLDVYFTITKEIVFLSY
jgi:hypothetical protein